MHIPLSQPLTLASHSPRRRDLLRRCGFAFSTEVRPTDEHFPDTIPPVEVPSFLARQKARRFSHDSAGRLVLCADTVVVRDGRIMNKPADAEEAREMLRKLSGATHSVHTAVCLLANEKMEALTDTAEVVFREFSETELDFYIEHQPPFDKAGGYGIQDWIGLVGIERIEGSYYTIMGLPTHRVYELLRPYFVV